MENNSSEVDRTEREKFMSLNNLSAGELTELDEEIIRFNIDYAKSNQ